MVGKGECMPRFTYVLGDVIIPRGGISDQTRVRYLCDANPANGWNTELKFDDANWHEGRTPIGSKKYFTRTDFRFSDLYIRKVFSADEVPRNAVLKIASDEGAEAWVNGHKVLSDISARHWANYWNYRLDITDFLKRGKNLLAFHVKRYEDVEEYEAGCFFDFELIFRKRSMEEIIFDFVKGRLSPDGGFSDDSIHSTFCAVSALKALDSIDVLDKDKVALWILLRKSVYGYFRDDGASIGAQNSAVETLKNLGLRLDDESSERLANLIISRREDDGRWSEFLWVDLEVTHRAIEALASLDALGRVKDWNKTIDWIKSLQGKDGGFSSKPGGSASLLSTFFAIRSLQLLNAMDSVNKEKAIEFIKSCYRNGGFDDKPEEMEEEKEWLAYSGVKSLEILNALNEV
ncbi:MAG: prenyltransferase/squalene oxidase repeat-containing protein [Thermoproteota archaeon]|nr:hypothetical protein [Candidatus Brockarchaeota archaeon]